MKRNYFKRSPVILFMIAMMFCCVTSSYSQTITTFQYRHVAPDKVDEFVKRETTYWSKVAKKAVDQGKMTFWALLEKVGGTDMNEAPNYMFINTFPDMDADLSKVFDPTSLFPGVPMSKMETYSISTETAMIFLTGDSTNGWQQAANAVPGKDFNYIVISYHNSTDPGTFNQIEKDKWAPFIKAAMDNGQSDQKAWGNSLVLAPTGGSMKFNCLSYDLYSTLTAALSPHWSADTKFPTDALDSLQKISLATPARIVYRIVKVVTKN